MFSQRSTVCTAAARARGAAKNHTNSKNDCTGHIKKHPFTHAKQIDQHGKNMPRPSSVPPDFHERQ